MPVKYIWTGIRWLWPLFETRFRAWDILVLVAVLDDNFRREKVSLTLTLREQKRQIQGSHGNLENSCLVQSNTWLRRLAKIPRTISKNNHVSQKPKFQLCQMVVVVVFYGHIITFGQSQFYAFLISLSRTCSLSQHYETTAHRTKARETHPMHSIDSELRPFRLARPIERNISPTLKHHLKSKTITKNK